MSLHKTRVSSINRSKSKTKSKSKNKSKSKSKTKSKKLARYIYYTGIGAKKSGKHTKQEFLTIMNRDNRTGCSYVVANNNYKPCSVRKSMDTKMEAYATKHNKIYGFNNRSCKSHNKYKKIMNKCIKYAENYNCNLDDYVEYSGAVYK